MFLLTGIVYTIRNRKENDFPFFIPVYIGDDSSVTVANSILWRNLPDEIGGAAEVTYSNIYQAAGVYPGAGNINADPLYEDGNNGDFRLQVNSPCIDAGLDSAVPVWLTGDFEGEQRRFDVPGVPTADHPEHVDMGADELVIYAVDVLTAPVTDITGNSALGGGTVSCDVPGVDVTDRGLCWNTVSDPTINDDTVSAGVGLGDFIALIENLELDVTYYVRAYAVQSEQVYYGDVQIFKTSGPPVVTTDGVSEIDATTALCSGAVADENGSAATQRGVCWNKSGNPTIEDDYTIEGSGAGEFSGLMMGLDPNATYFVSAWAANEYGVGYGLELEFKTAATPSKVWVDDDYSADPNDNDGYVWHIDAFDNIQQAIDAVNKPGGTVYVNAGTYYENIMLKNEGGLIYHELDIIGAGAEDAIIDGGQNGSVVTFMAVMSCKLQGFTIRNGNGVNLQEEAQGQGLQDESDEIETHGGGMFLDASSPDIIDCIFEQNSATVFGGAIFNTIYSNPTINNCVFRQNTAGVHGGAICNLAVMPFEEKSLIINNCVFTGNQAQTGGAVANNSSFGVTINSSAFYDNRVGPPGSDDEIVTGGAIFNAGSMVNVYNSIVWNNDPNQIENVADSVVAVQYCDVEGGFGAPEDNNIDADPMFMGSDNLQPSAGSEVVDAGNNDFIHPDYLTDLNGWDRIADGDCDGAAVIDMGAYELNFKRIGDCDDDCDIDMDDFKYLSQSWQLVDCEDCSGSDVNNDGSVNLLDLQVQAGYWLTGVD